MATITKNKRRTGSKKTIPAKTIEVTGKIGVTKFRENIKAYLNLAKEKGKIKIHSNSTGSFYIVPADEIDEANYNPEFVKKILQSEADFKAGRYKSIDTKDLWK